MMMDDTTKHACICTQVRVRACLRKVFGAWYIWLIYLVDPRKAPAHTFTSYSASPCNGLDDVVLDFLDEGEDIGPEQHDMSGSLSYVRSMSSPRGLGVFAGVTEAGRSVLDNILACGVFAVQIILSLTN